MIALPVEVVLVAPSTEPEVELAEVALLEAELLEVELPDVLVPPALLSPVVAADVVEPPLVFVAVLELDRFASAGGAPVPAESAEQLDWIIAVHATLRSNARPRLGGDVLEGCT